MPDRTTDFFVALETRVWEALAAGDPDADRALLSDDFVGLYPEGFATRDEHAAELADGPTVGAYRISQERVIEVAPDSVLLCYRADYEPAGGGAPEAMYVSSLWVERAGRWWNTFSQDCVATR
ncbi:MAG TPA: nuclear transport factor 2 family protein [Promicromonospora sp.]|nr:nuclear transport factor 2 family protein [Promicromonospora sp.]